ncbi:MAG: lysylphosphatidylglycerol synthase domain-containing protein [Candidatus Promineifilaceae bacterium]|nr:lysylphosphatidylglycerol synthase domain-containing protein [Candidatus Promineifilaceae bacterium]
MTGEEAPSGKRIPGLERGRRFYGAIKGSRLLGILLLTAFLGAAVVVLFRDWQRLRTYSFELQPGLLALSFVVECVGLLLAVLVWRQLLLRFTRPIAYSDDLRIYSYSMLGVVLPGGIWSVVSRSALYERRGISAFDVGTASVIEFILMGIAGLLVYALLAFVQPVHVIWQRPAIAVAMVLVALALIQPPLFNRIANWLNRRAGKKRVQAVPLRYWDLLRWLIMECGVVAIGGVAVYLLLQSVTPTSLDLLFPIISAWAVAVVTGNLFFWLPGTPVIRDGFMALILAQLLPPALAIAFVVIVRVWTLLSILVLIGLIWVLIEPKSR